VLLPADDVAPYLDEAMGWAFGWVDGAAVPLVGQVAAEGPGAGLAARSADRFVWAATVRHAQNEPELAASNDEEFRDVAAEMSGESPGAAGPVEVRRERIG